MLWKILVIFFVSMVPLIELRGAVPIGVGLGGLPEWAVLIIAVIGNMVPVPLIFLFARKVLEWGTSKCKWRPFKKICTFCLKKGQKGGEKLLKKARGGTYWALFLFVAIPIPGTGAWTGTLAASILDLDFKKTMFTICAGVITAGLIMLLASLGIFNGILGS